MIKNASRILEKTEKIFVVIASALIVFVSLTIILEVFSRMLFNISYSWVMELSEYSLLYIPFLMAAWLLRHNEHIVIDLLEDFLPQWVKYVLDIIIFFIGIFTCIILTWFGMVTTFDYFVNGIHTQTTLHIPKGYISIIIPIGSFLLLLEFIRLLTKKIKFVDE